MFYRIYEEVIYIDSLYIYQYVYFLKYVYFYFVEFRNQFVQLEKLVVYVFVFLIRDILKEEFQKFKVDRKQMSEEFFYYQVELEQRQQEYFYLLRFIFGYFYVEDLLKVLCEKEEVRYKDYVVVVEKYIKDLQVSNLWIGVFSYSV